MRNKLKKSLNEYSQEVHDIDQQSFALGVQHVILMMHNAKKMKLSEEVVNLMIGDLLKEAQELLEE